jgi:hypothetical protein
MFDLRRCFCRCRSLSLGLLPLLLPLPFLETWTLSVQCSIFAVAVVFALASPRFPGYAVAMTKRTDKDVSARVTGCLPPVLQPGGTAGFSSTARRIGQAGMDLSIP